MKNIFILFCFILFAGDIVAQNDSAVFAAYTTSVNRAKLYNNIVSSINKYLLFPLNPSTEEKWQDVFWSMELINFKTPWVNNRIHYAFDSVESRSYDFKRSLLELAFTNYPNEFTKEITDLITQTSEPKIFAMCAEYLLQNRNNQSISLIKNLLSKKFETDAGNAIIYSLKKRLLSEKIEPATKLLTDLFSRNFFANNVVVYSLQRKNRNYPGIVLVRNKEGIFIRDSAGIFNVPQLARSITNLPGYLTNGNTPQGIFRMDGFAVSAGSFIGPTTNVQLTMPVETSLQHFMKDSTITDSVWTEDWYKTLLPQSLKNYSPLYGTFYSGKAGRTEIIAHGTTIDPEYYKGRSYYPHTPSQGCLCTKELWSSANGKRIYSDQLKLVNAIKQAGGADGYVVVIELEDKQQPVTLNEVLPFIIKAEANK